MPKDRRLTDQECLRFWRRLKSHEVFVERLAAELRQRQTGSANLSRHDVDEAMNLDSELQHARILRSSLWVFKSYVEET